ncbi:MAG: 2-amino-4-hydroxy-6-hydroxymethyldihydropteridine diphosphokinase [Anaerolineales bacterium]|nr:2-amino-4-hydroxy-6-hydroxymethyldihydropteridine diphosphokinase [Anaerolineales bacterium]
MYGENEKVHQVVLSLGSNIEPEKNLAVAVGILEGKVKVISRSSIWKTAPVGMSGNSFLNGAILIETELSAEDLKLNVLRWIENNMGRKRTENKFSDRVIDLDIVVYDGIVMDEQLWERAYLAVPVAEIMPEVERGERKISLVNLAVVLKRSQKILRKGTL